MRESDDADVTDDTIARRMLEQLTETARPLDLYRLLLTEPPSAEASDG